MKKKSKPLTIAEELVVCKEYVKTLRKRIKAADKGGDEVEVLNDLEDEESVTDTKIEILSAMLKMQKLLTAYENAVRSDKRSNIIYGNNSIMDCCYNIIEH